MTKRVKTGLELFFEKDFKKFKGKRVGLIVNQASIIHDYTNTVELFSSSKVVKLAAVFGPQHGIHGNTQDNMITWQGFTHSKLKIPVYSLYGETRIPTKEMLSDLDVLIFDLQDVGTRIYTFIYTMANAMKACVEYGKKFVVLDRPNPINGVSVEGDILEEKFSSFVGMYPIPVRHGMTVGELAKFFNKEFKIGADLEVIKMRGWKRNMWFDNTSLPWILPSPNMPFIDTASAFPGTVFFEGTNISEGRGTTRPFEIIGAPFIDPDKLISALVKEKLPGVLFTPYCFEPTFNKWKGEICGGIYIHVTDRNKFKPVITGISIIKAIYKLYPELFKWKKPPYEYEYEKLPFDVIAGTDKLRKQIIKNTPIKKIEASWSKSLSLYMKTREKYLLY
ncbi:MAG: hypothetical protein A3C43_10125 [Candidatus Schekmanbacteria bacterium RIFCSPHIGHO2_02_FULL_38_11]|uniref:DUF1343 domain-containing protein n=1 Tax=Candidatus Schekmanbacteria bacterium RIFCSPLOWO2_12_FULL_38_15 TaxID=1817883 RepID=A0A1F7SL23_9BACT|nr:MAG: hypothetical protein A2043_05625 [Candidatus Schekmanbacteria bacterium GWA2_38_9]OGL48052.1 MAG: hypothetical protein A3H37_08515 [Candidatus Schekmanbacteria bacterium RIFCSPLOWO2_02_FULL_38_14]OGL50716.1 MAG: hypothetical protein A3C43_10125 [Candidatus Schekmanbacteria bacterium RIFCSPHIGHO2_02_FULL_38_11]OGL54463.1 MAG: hypothetical protein A3G31_09875 [Candidatus Schekmanbacteria bacterium RIFCSPLOWO2_12_FULL_38_15]